MSIAQEQADIQREEAKRLLNVAFGLNENYRNSDIDRVIDCIISAAILEAMVIINQGMQESMANRATSDNP